MKLLKFVNCDAPNVSPDLLRFSVSKQVISMSSGISSDRGSRGTASSSERGDFVGKRWRISRGGAPIAGGYWLLGDNDELLGPVSEVFLAVPEIRDEDAIPRGIDESAVQGVEFFNKFGRNLQQTRELFGDTYLAAPRNIVPLGDAGRIFERQAEKVGRRHKRRVGTLEEEVEHVDSDVAVRATRRRSSVTAHVSQSVEREALRPTKRERKERRTSAPRSTAVQDLEE